MEIQMLSFILVAGNLICMAFLAFIRQQGKTAIAELKLNFQSEISRLEKDQAQSAQRKYERIRNNETRIEEVAGFNKTELALLKESKKTLAEKIEKLEEMIEKQSLKLDSQAEVMLKIYEIVSRDKK